MRLIKEISHDSNVVGHGPAYRWQSAASGAVQEMAEAFLVREFESELPYVFL
jgi:histone H3/H4